MGQGRRRAGGYLRPLCHSVSQDGGASIQTLTSLTLPAWSPWYHSLQGPGQTSLEEEEAWSSGWRLWGSRGQAQEDLGHKGKEPSEMWWKFSTYLILYASLCVLVSKYRGAPPSQCLHGVTDAAFSPICSGNFAAEPQEAPPQGALLLASLGLCHGPMPEFTSLYTHGHAKMSCRALR